MTDIAARTAFITGGANGIGLGIARSLARAGARIALVDLDEEALARAAAELGGLTRVHAVRLDVRDRDAYASVADEVETALGPVSILVNNAGVAGGANASKLTYELWDWNIGINLGGVINGVQTFLPRMLARGGGGHIVNTASGAGLTASSGGGVLYCTAKFGVVGMTEALCMDLEPRGVGVTLLCPGPTATGIMERTIASQPRTERPMSPERQAAASTKLEMMKQHLATGKSPDDVGDMVRDAIEADRLYVITHREAGERIENRTKALLEALPPL